MRAIQILKSVLPLVFCLVANSAHAADPVAGNASIVVGTVSSLAPNGAARVLSKDDAVFNGDRISTGDLAYVRLTFVDGSSMVLRPNTDFTIESFRYGSNEPSVQVVAPGNPAQSTALQVANQSQTGNQAVFRLLRGGFRAVSGLIGKVNRQEYAVHTPVATIGIRGTVFLSVACDAICAADSIVQGSLPAGETALGGTVSAVDQGSVVLTSISGKVASVDAAQFVLTTASGLHVTLPALPAFLTGESWLSLAEQAAPVATEAAQPTLAPATNVSTGAVPATLATVLMAGAIAIAAEAEDGNAVPAPIVTTIPSTSTAR